MSDKKARALHDRVPALRQIIGAVQFFGVAICTIGCTARYMDYSDREFYHHHRSWDELSTPDFRKGLVYTIAIMFAQDPSSTIWFTAAR